MSKFRVYRFFPKSRAPYMESFPVPKSCKKVLDGLIFIKKELDSTLTFAKSCRQGKCGACAVNINGVNKLACITDIPKGTVRIYPLAYMYVIKDLVVDMSRFFEQFERVQPWLIRRYSYKIWQSCQSPEDRKKFKSGCILCGICSSGCPTYQKIGSNSDGKDFLGPAALQIAHRWLNDSRDKGREDRLQDLKDYYHLYRCHKIYNCTMTCPQDLNPGEAINELRNSVIQKPAKLKVEVTALQQPVKRKPMKCP